MKKLELKIIGCAKCPYCQYDSYYSTSHDSGWDCNHPDTKNLRIIDEGISNGNLESIKNAKKVKNILKTQIPEWCPLPDISIKKKIWRPQ